MKLYRFLLPTIVSLILACNTSSSNILPEKTGGPCNYKVVNVIVNEIEYNQEFQSTTIRLTPHQEVDEKLWEKKLYADLDTLTILQTEEEYLLFLTVDSRLILGEINVMTKGSCNPYPISIKIEDNYYSIVN